MKYFCLIILLIISLVALIIAIIAFTKNNKRGRGEYFTPTQRQLAPQCGGSLGWGPIGSAKPSFGQFWPYLISSSEGGSGIWSASGWAGSDPTKFPSFTPRCFTARCYSSLSPGAENGTSSSIDPGLLTISNKLLVGLGPPQGSGHTLLYAGPQGKPYSPTTDSGYVGSANYIVDGLLSGQTTTGMRLNSSTGNGFPMSWSAAYTFETAPPRRMNIWSGCIHTANYNGPFLLAHPYYFYANTASDPSDLSGLPLKPGVAQNAAMPAHHMPPGTIMTNGIKFQGFKITLDIELNTFPNGISIGNNEFEIGQFQFPWDKNLPASSDLAKDFVGSPVSYIWAKFNYYMGPNGSNLRVVDPACYIPTKDALPMVPFANVQQVLLKSVTDGNSLEITTNHWGNGFPGVNSGDQISLVKIEGIAKGNYASESKVVQYKSCPCINCAPTGYLPNDGACCFGNVECQITDPKGNLWTKEECMRKNTNGFRKGTWCTNPTTGTVTTNVENSSTVNVTGVGKTPFNLDNSVKINGQDVGKPKKIISQFCPDVNMEGPFGHSYYTHVFSAYILRKPDPKAQLQYGCGSSFTVGLTSYQGGYGMNCNICPAKNNKKSTDASVPDPVGGFWPDGPENPSTLFETPPFCVQGRNGPCNIDGRVSCCGDPAHNSTGTISISRESFMSDAIQEKIPFRGRNTGRLSRATDDNIAAPLIPSSARSIWNYMDDNSENSGFLFGFAFPLAKQFAKDGLIKMPTKIKKSDQGYVPVEAEQIRLSGGAPKADPPTPKLDLLYLDSDQLLPTNNYYGYVPIVLCYIPLAYASNTINQAFNKISPWILKYSTPKTSYAQGTYPPSPPNDYPQGSSWTNSKWQQLQKQWTGYETGRTCFQWKLLTQSNEIIIYKWMKFTDQPNFKILITEQVYKNAVDENNNPYTEKNSADWIARWQNCIANIQKAGDSWDPTKNAIPLPGYSIT